MKHAPGHARVRIARATARLDAMTAFYRDGLGFEVSDAFGDHDGYSGVILAIHDGVELELTSHDRGRVGEWPDPDDLLVLYLPSQRHVDSIAARLERSGCARVEPLNPYWRGRAVTFADPDGWRVVICADANR